MTARRARTRRWLVLPLVAVAALSPFRLEASDGSRTAEHVTLRNGFDLVCDHREETGSGRVRLYTGTDNSNFVEVALDEVASTEVVNLPRESSPEDPQALPASIPASATAASRPSDLTHAELQQLLSAAGSKHHLDVDLLASLVHAESGGHTGAVSRTGAKGLMQLMPSTAAELGVTDSFHPEDNIAGGTAYLDSLLYRYHDNLALALAAYNAGPAAVARWHGVPPYRETRLYVARVIRDFNAAARKSAAASHSSRLMARSASQLPAPTLLAGAVPH